MEQQRTGAQRIAQFVAALTLGRIPEEVVAAAKLHLLDTLGCGLAALALGEGDFVVAAAGEECGPGRASALGIARGVPAREAALVNGTMFHALDFDDTHPDSVVHVSASVVAAALAAAQAAGSSGAELLCALVAGNETSTRVGMAAGGRFHARGLHPTSVCGIFGATAAAARIRGLDPAATANALGIAGSMSAGLLEFLADGSKTKPLHPGWAAHAAVSAVALASHGGTGPASVLEGRRGLLGAYLHGEQWDLHTQLGDLGERWETPRMAFKPYPACHYVHAPVDALVELVREHGLAAAEVESIVAFSDETGVGMVLDPLVDKLRPRTPYDAKFSLPYCLASQLLRGRVDVSTFSAAAIAEERVLELAGRVSYETKVYAATPDSFPGGVLVRTKGGAALEAELRHQRGGAENPFTDAEVEEKYLVNAGMALGAAEAERLAAAVLRLQAMPDLSAFGVLARAGAGT